MHNGGGYEDEVLGRAYDRRLVARLWIYVRPYRGLIALTVALFPFIAGVELIQPYLIKVAIDQHILKGDWPGLAPVAGFFLLALVGQYLFRFWQVYVMNLTGQRVTHDLRLALFSHVQKLDARFFDRNPVGRVMTRVVNDVEALNEMFSAGVVAILGDGVTLLGVVAVMLWMDWRLALVTFSVIPVLFAVAFFFRLRARDAYRAVRTRIARLNAFLQENLQGLTVVKLFVRERAHLEEFKAINGEYRQALFTSMTFDSALYAIVEVIGFLATALLLWYGGGQIIREALTFGVLVAFLEYTHRFFLPIRDLSAKYAVMQSAMASGERIFTLLDTAPAVAPPAVARRPAALAGRVEFDGVWFAYQGEEWVLRDLSFRVDPGRRVALVGVTGAGKSTIAKLLNRSYDVQQGRVLVDGIDVREWDLERLRRWVGEVSQDVFLFSGSVAENLRLATPHTISDRLQEASRLANADRFIRSLPKGYDELLQERGANLSQGQRQLLAIARTLVYDPAVLVMDEATSSVDSETEAMIQEALEHLLASRTSLVIAHRLSTVQQADRILVLHKGRLREEGSHQTLMARGGLYSRLYELQFGNGPRGHAHLRESV